MGQTTLGGATALPGPLFGTAAGQLAQGFVLTIPEPSSVALGILGMLAAALFVRRGRKNFE